MTPPLVWLHWHGRGPLWGEDGFYRVAMEEEGSGDYPGVSAGRACSPCL